MINTFIIAYIFVAIIVDLAIQYTLISLSESRSFMYCIAIVVVGDALGAIWPIIAFIYFIKCLIETIIEILAKIL